MDSQRARNWQAQWGEKCGDGLLMASLAWAVFAIGGTLPWSVAGLLLVVAFSTLVNVGLGRFRFDAGVAVLLGMAVYVALQTLPLPVAWIGMVDREHGETWARVFRALGVTGAATLSLEPDTTRYEAVRFLCYAMTWGTVSAHAKANGPIVVARWVTGLVLVTAVVTVLHRMLGVYQVYGGYAPRFANARWVGPLLNPNNLGGFCNLGVFCALASASRQAGRGNPTYFAVAAGLACLTVLTGSRGATIALAGGILLFFGAWLRARRRLPQMQHWGLAYAAVAGLTLLALTLDRAVIEDLSGKSIEKLSLMHWALMVLREHPWVGIGMGAFGSAAATVSGHSGNVAFPYVECFPLDLLTGLGVPVAVVVLASGALGLWRIGGGLRTHTLRLGLCVVLVQNLMDLGLSVPGLALPWLSVFAGCWGGATRRTWSASSKWTSWVSAAAASSLGALLALPLAEPVGLLRREVGERLNAADGVARLDAALQRYPADAYLLRIKAAAAMRDESPDALTWVNAALLRAPADARTHLLLAQLLLARRRVDQALPSLRIAAQDRTLHAEIARLVGIWAPARLIDAVPDGPLGAALLRLVAGNRSDSERVVLLEAAEHRAPSDVATSVELTRAKMREASARNLPCEETTPCFRELNARVELASRLGATPAQVHVLRALLMALSGDIQGGFDLLLSQCERSPQARACLQVLVELGNRLGPAAFERAVSVFLDSVCGGQQSCSAERMGLAAELTRQGGIAKAHEIYVRECSASGLPEAFIQAARTAMRVGRAREALHWLDKAEDRHREDAATMARLDAVRAEISAAIPAAPSPP